MRSRSRCTCSSGAPLSMLRRTLLAPGIPARVSFSTCAVRITSSRSAPLRVISTGALRGTRPMVAMVMSTPGKWCSRSARRAIMVASVLCPFRASLGTKSMVSSERYSAPTPMLPMPVLGPPTLLKTLATSGSCIRWASSSRVRRLFSCRGTCLSYSKVSRKMPWSPVAISSLVMMPCLSTAPVAAKSSSTMPRKAARWASTQRNCRAYQSLRRSSVCSKRSSPRVHAVLGCRSSR